MPESSNAAPLGLTEAVPRLFVAVWPPADVVATLAELRRDEAGVRFLATETWHVTLRFFGEADPDEASAALAGGSYPSATARLGPAVGIIARSAVAVPVHGLDALAADVISRTAAIGQPPRADFRGHLTIARLKTHRVRTSLRGERIHAEFGVGEVALVRSHLGSQGARYDTIASWKTTTSC